MGGVAVPNHQVCMKEAFWRKPLITPSRKKKPRRSHNAPSSNCTQHSHTKKIPSRRMNTTASSPAQKASPLKNLVVGQVKILKRGEELTVTSADKENRGEPNLDLGLKERLGPDPTAVPVMFYAGPSTFASPLPSSLPLPTFFTKKCAFPKTDDVAT
ncbi:uncharacterized protein LOC132190687 [Corylus avellana]|uniref:uncharacterized protein LOC132190572 n=1 Tax=Corylus avellana TaxID=13451 RepID=UPI001E1F4071|nr:uncharacterized protein LOC132190572 [Corylus avellana]XP_059461711.1 uncharacterized protein LOC132190687 [Corylus avellana]